MQYQHRVTIWNFDDQTRTIGVFRSRKEAEEFMLANEGAEKTYTAEMNDQPWPYGVLRQPFNVRAKMAAMWSEREEDETNERLDRQAGVK